MATWLATLVLAAVASGCGAPPPTDMVERLRDLERPNIVLLIVDTLRADALTPYGAPASSTPELARWAAEGVVFENVLAQSSWTKVSMVSMMTSLWPRSHGVLGIRDAIAAPAVTLAESLREGGYRTYAVQSNGWLEQTFGFHQGFDHYVIPKGNQQGWMGTQVWPHAENIYEEASRLIEGHDRSDPFFLYLHFMDVHEYAAPTEFKVFGSDSLGSYRAAVRFVDAIFEALRGTLAEEGLLESTVLLVASDHAESFGENQSFGHAKHLFTPVLKVPLLMRLPVGTPALRVSSQVRNLDLAPTILDLAGLAVPDFYEGESLLPLLREVESRDRLSYASLTDVLFKMAKTQDAVGDGRWSFVRDLDAGGREYLFDRDVDPDEDVNLVAIEVDEAKRLRSLLDAYRESEVAGELVVPEVRIEPGLAKKLQALGYIRE